MKNRFVFRVVGNKEVGMGHIYRALTLAHEFSNYEVLFVTDMDNQIAVESILKEDYWLGVYSVADVTSQIKSLQPEVVIYDALDTSCHDVRELRDSGVVVVSFEDLGDGSRYTNLTINELFDKPQFEGDHILWGHDYFWTGVFWRQFSNSTCTNFCRLLFIWSCLCPRLDSMCWSRFIRDSNFSRIR